MIGAGVRDWAMAAGALTDSTQAAAKASLDAESQALICVTLILKWGGSFFANPDIAALFVGLRDGVYQNKLHST